MSTRGIEWLSAAADDPAACQAAWVDDSRIPYVLPTGRVFDVVTVPQRVGMEAFDQLLRRGSLFAPVALDRKARRVGFFLGVRSQDVFSHHLGNQPRTALVHRYLGCGSVVVVPGPAPVTGDRHQWLRAPTRCPIADPAHPVVLAAVLVASAELLAAVDRYGEHHSSAVGSPIACSSGSV